MKGVTFRHFALDTPTGAEWFREHGGVCRVCKEKITYRAYYCREHSRLKIKLNQQMRKWKELEDKLERGIITEEEAKAIRIWP